ncbi:DUF6055 domain-containing protein [Sphingomonas silueang]|uniref:DUF6055 domain-containing protein n=1 Tax=Sphingomonas silueang TaxID=3156617 RepID=UPI0032B37BB0
MRQWTPRDTRTPEDPFATPGLLTGAPFSARLVQAYGEDNGEARRTVILEMADGCRRQFRAESFVDADRARIDAEVTRHPSAPDPAHYRRRDEYDADTQKLIDEGRLRVYETQHFAIWYGVNKNGSFYKTMAEQGRPFDKVLEETGAWAEKQWLINRDVLNAPLPYADSADKQKIGIHFCGTGRPLPDDDDIRDCGASGGGAIAMGGHSTKRGSNVLTHEFAHVIQFYTGGYSGRKTAGPFWETGAEWNAFKISPTFPAQLIPYFNAPERGPVFTQSRYSNHPVLSFLFDKDDTRDLVFGAWRRNLRDTDGTSREDYFQTFVRIAKADGVYPKGWRSFADDMGWYGARLVSMDFVNQRTFLDVLSIRERPSADSFGRKHTVPINFYTALTPVATGGQAAVYAPPAQRDLMEFGTHIVPLKVVGRSVKVTLTGGTTANEAAWRFTLVSVDASGAATYAPMAAVTGRGSATVTMKPAAGAKLFLAVTATPYVYEPMGADGANNPGSPTRFPYRVDIRGATP